MDSSTTDVCEWCKRPFLPPGAKVTTKKPGKPGQVPPAGQPPASEAASPAAPPPELLSSAEESEPAAEARPARAPTPAAEDILRPLGDQPATEASGPSAPAGIDTETSVDMSAYVGADQSILQPLERPQPSAAPTAGRDPLAARRQAVRERTSGEIPETVRMGRSLVAGLVICVLMSILQFLVTHNVPRKLYFLPLGNPEYLVTAVFYGMALGVLLGGALGAALVQFKRGPFVGILVGLLIGWLGLQNPPWGQITGGLCGAIVGYFAAKGMRRVVNV